MPFTVTMPKLSPTMEEGALAKWHKAEGDFVEAGDLLIEVSTDKATVEYNALDSGWLRKILISQGKVASVNQPIAIFTEQKEESIEGYEPKGLVRVETVAQAKEEQTEHPIPSSQPAKTPLLQQPIFAPEPPLTQYEFEQPTDSLGKRIFATPLARKLAKERGLDLSTVKGTGPNQRIVSADLEKAQPLGKIVFGHRSSPSRAPGSYEEEALTPMRKIIGQRLQESKSFIPHFYVEQTINAEALIEIREQLNHFQIKPSINDFVIKASSLALRDHPHINSGYNSVNQAIIRYLTIDIAVAVTLESGLITPIIRHADFKNLGELSVEMRHLAKTAKEGKLEPHEYKGGSFTISNLGMYGITNFSAIINPPQAAILAVSGIQSVPVVKNNSVVPGKVMNLTLSVDHRVIDGVTAAQFMKTLQKYLENPAVLLV